MNETSSEVDLKLRELFALQQKMKSLTNSWWRIVWRIHDDGILQSSWRCMEWMVYFIQNEINRNKERLDYAPWKRTSRFKTMDEMTSEWQWMKWNGSKLNLFFVLVCRCGWWRVNTGEDFFLLSPHRISFITLLACTKEGERKGRWEKSLLFSSELDK